MIDQDRKGFLILLAMLGEAFKEDVSSERAKIYFEFLKPYSLYQIMGTIKQIIKTLKFYPKIAEFIEIIDPYNGYQLIESDESKKLRLKKENQELFDFLNQISKIIGRKREPDIRQLK